MCVETRFDVFVWLGFYVTVFPLHKDKEIAEGIIKCSSVNFSYLTVLCLLPCLRAQWSKYIDHNTGDWWQQTSRHWPPVRGGALHCLAATINIAQSGGRGSWKLEVNLLAGVCNMSTWCQRRALWVYKVKIRILRWGASSKQIVFVV